MYMEVRTVETKQTLTATPALPTPEQLSEAIYTALVTEKHTKDTNAAAGKTVEESFSADLTAMRLRGASVPDEAV